jgi:hypothetical protein
VSLTAPATAPAASEATRYHKIGHDPGAIENLFVTLFLEAHKTPPAEIILDLDPTDDDPLATIVEPRTALMGEG